MQCNMLPQTLCVSVMNLFSRNQGVCIIKGDYSCTHDIHGHSSTNTRVHKRQKIGPQVTCMDLLEF